MNHRSKVLALSSALAVLLLIYGAGALFSPERMAARAEKSALLQGPVSEAASLSLGGRAGTEPVPDLEFAKEGQSWVLRDQGRSLPVVQSRLVSLLDSLAAVARLSPRSESTGGLEGFGLGPGEGRRVVVRTGSGKTLADFELGGYGPTGNEVYLRRAGAPTVYATDSGFASALDQERAAWLDLRIFPGPLKPEEVSSLLAKASIVLEGKTPTLLSWSASRQDGGWTSPAGKYDSVGVESILRSILNLEGQDIVALPPASAFSKVQARLELDLAKGGKLGLEVGASAGEDRFYLRSLSGPQVYLVSSYSLKNLLRAPQPGK